MKIGNRQIGERCPCYVIAEIGLNHNGSRDLAYQMILSAKQCGVDAVKFQKRDVKTLLTDNMYNKPYNGPHSYGSTYGEHREALELSIEDHSFLMAAAHDNGLHFIISAWNGESVRQIDGLGVDAFKIASADITSHDLLMHIRSIGKPVIMSTGMSTEEEIQSAYKIFHGMEDNIAILHCISTYPFDDKYANLKAIKTLKEKYKVPIGYSGHEKSGNAISVAARVLGACIIERHFTLDRTMKGPDHAASLTPTGLRSLVEAIRKIESAMGNGKLDVADIEKPVREKLAKVVVVKKDIKKGQPMGYHCLEIKCAGKPGLSARHIASMRGIIAEVDIKVGEPLPIEAKMWRDEYGLSDFNEDTAV